MRCGALGRATGMSGSVYRPEGRRICGGTGRGQTHDVCDGSGLQSMSFWEESLKGSPRRTLLGCKRRGKESSGFWREADSFAI